MSQWYSLFPQSTVCVPRVQFMSLEYSLCPYITVYVLEYCLCPQSPVSDLQCTVYVLGSQFVSLEYSLCPQSTVYVPRVQFMSLEYS